MNLFFQRSFVAPLEIGCIVSSVLGVILLCGLFWAAKNRSAAQDPSVSMVPLTCAVLIATGLVIVCISTLDSYAGSLLTWECETTGGFAEHLSQNISLVEYIRSLLPWHDGTLSGSSQSLAFGGPAYALFQGNGFSLFNLRLVALIAGVLVIPAMVLLSFELNSRWAPYGIALAVLANPVIIYYMRYGVSLSISFLLCTLALVAAVRSCRKPSFFSGIITGIFLIACTFAYAPARLFAIGLGIGLLLQVFFLPVRRLVGLIAGVFLPLALVGAYEFKIEATSHVLSGRGEQAIEMLRTPEGVARVTQIPLENVVKLSRKEQLRIGIQAIVTARATEVAKLLSPWMVEWPSEASARDLGDPPDIPLISLAMYPLVIVGLLIAFIRIREPLALLTLCTSVTLIGPILFTNRADLHRVALLVIPATICFGIAIAWLEALVDVSPDSSEQIPVWRMIVQSTVFGALVAATSLGVQSNVPLLLNNHLLISNRAVSSTLVERIQHEPFVHVWVREGCSIRYTVMFDLVRSIGVTHVKMVNIGTTDIVQRDPEQAIPELQKLTKDGVVLLSSVDISDIGRKRIEGAFGLSEYGNLYLVYAPSSVKNKKSL